MGDCCVSWLTPLVQHWLTAGPSDQYKINDQTEIDDLRGQIWYFGGNPSLIVGVGYGSMDAFCVNYAICTPLLMDWLTGINK